MCSTEGESRAMWKEVLGTVASKRNTIHIILLKIVSHSVVSDSCDPTTGSCLWNSPGWSGGHFLLQGIFLTQGPNLGLLHCRQIFYHLSHQKSPIPTQLTQIKPKTHSGNEEAYGTCDHQRPEKTVLAQPLEIRSISVTWFCYFPTKC